MNFQQPTRGESIRLYKSPESDLLDIASVYRRSEVDGIESKRTHTNITCRAITIVVITFFLLGTVIIPQLNSSNKIILHPSSYLGEFCGETSAVLSKPFIYFPNLLEPYHGVCVSKCPTSNTDKFSMPGAGDSSMFTFVTYASYPGFQNICMPFNSSLAAQLIIRFQHITHPLRDLAASLGVLLLAPEIFFVFIPVLILSLMFLCFFLLTKCGRSIIIPISFMGGFCMLLSASLLLVESSNLDRFSDFGTLGVMGGASTNSIRLSFPPSFFSTHNWFSTLFFISLVSISGYCFYLGSDVFRHWWHMRRINSQPSRVAELWARLSIFPWYSFDGLWTAVLIMGGIGFVFYSWAIAVHTILTLDVMVIRDGRVVWNGFSSGQLWISLIWSIVSLFCSQLIFSIGLFASFWVVICRYFADSEGRSGALNERQLANHQESMRMGVMMGDIQNVQGSNSKSNHHAAHEGNGRQFSNVRRASHHESAFINNFSGFETANFGMIHALKCAVTFHLGTIAWVAVLTHTLSFLGILLGLTDFIFRIMCLGKIVAPRINFLKSQLDLFSPENAIIGCIIHNTDYRASSKRIYSLNARANLFIPSLSNGLSKCQRNGIVWGCAGPISVIIAFLFHGVSVNVMDPLFSFSRIMRDYFLPAEAFDIHSTMNGHSGVVAGLLGASSAVWVNFIFLCWLSIFALSIIRWLSATSVAWVSIFGISWESNGGLCGSDWRPGGSSLVEELAAEMESEMIIEGSNTTVHVLE